MKHGKKPTRKQKVLIRQQGLNPDEYCITKSLVNELHIVHRKTNQVKKIVF